VTVQRATAAQILLVLLLLLSGCAGHSRKTLEARQALDAGQPDRAMTLYNKVLKVKSASELPEKDRKNSAILVLDRSMISQQLGEYQDSSRDLEYADKAVEMLDMSRTAVADIGKYLFSDDVGPYKGPPYEKVMINTMNMVNYLARHDLNGARIEARRLAIIQKYLTDNKHPAEEMNAPGAYLAGFVFEKSGRPDIALRYYDEALKHGDFASLAKPIAELHGSGSYSTPRLREFLKKHGVQSPSVPAATLSRPPPSVPQVSAGRDSPESSAEEEELAEGDPPEASVALSATSNLATIAPKDPNAPGDLLVIVSYGRVPAKIAKRIPIGLALTYASANMTGPNQNTANRLAAQGLVTWVNYPELEETYRRLPPPSLSINGSSFSTETLAAMDTATRKAYDKVRGAIIASAITRMITRVVAGESLGAAARGASDNNIIGALVSLGTQAALTAADTPDTRSWVTLPARMEVTRLRLKPGRHRVVLSAQGQTRTFDVNMEPGGWEVVSLTSLR
jgi:uncharacterized protein